MLWFPYNEITGKKKTAGAARSCLEDCKPKYLFLDKQMKHRVIFVGRWYATAIQIIKNQIFITPKRVTSGGAHLRGIASGQAQKRSSGGEPLPTAPI